MQVIQVPPCLRGDNDGITRNGGATVSSSWFYCTRAFAMLTACLVGPGLLVQGRTMHPASEHLVRPEGVPVTELRFDRPVATTDFSRELTSRLLGATLLASIGQDPDSPLETAFGNVAAVLASSDGRVFVLDDRLDNVRVFGTDGSYRETIGRPGPGPGEIAGPLSVSLDETHQLLYVGDKLREIDVFSVAQEPAEFKESIRVPSAEAESMCILQSSLLLVDDVPSAEGGLAHVYSEGQAEIPSFGLVYDSPSAVANTTLSNTLVACGFGDADVLIAAVDVGDIHAFSRDGERLWIASAEATFVDSAYIYESRGAVGMSPPRRAFQIKTLNRVGNGHALVQIGEYRPSEHSGFETVGMHSLVIETRSGASAYLGSDLPQVVAIGDNYFVSLHGQEADPWIAIRRFD